MTSRRTLAGLAALLAAALPTAAAQPAAAQPGAAQGLAPVADPGGPYSLECTGDKTFIEVDGSASYDPDGTPVTFEWYEECEHGYFDLASSAKAIFVLESGGMCEHECSHLELRVTSGGETTRERFSIVVEDTTPPVMVCPPDQVAVWGASTDPLDMGMGYAEDDCSNQPVVTWVDSFIPGEECSGIEETIKRDWIASDACGNFAEDTQYITLLSPSGGCNGTPPTNLELDPKVCENLLDPTERSGLFRANLLSRKFFNVMNVDPMSVRLFRLDQPTKRVRPFMPRRSPIGDFIKAAAFQFKTCSPSGQDKQLDISFRFVKSKVIDTLELEALADGETVTIVLAGRTKDGVAFWAGDMLTVDQPEEPQQ